MYTDNMAQLQYFPTDPPGGASVPAAGEDRGPGRLPGAGCLSAERFDVRPTRAGPRGHGRWGHGASLGGYVMCTQICVCVVKNRET